MTNLMFLILTLISGERVFAKELLVSVAQFENKAGSSSCRLGADDWWWDNLGDAFQALAQEELTKIAGVGVLEREGIEAIYNNEVDLINSQKIQTLKKGRFQQARYTVIGTVTKYEFCSEKSGASVNVAAVAGLFGAVLPDVEVGLSGAKARVEVQLRLVDAETGRILRSAKASGDSKSSNFDLGTEFGSYGQAKNSPIGDASEQAIAKAITQLNISKQR